MEYPEEKHNVFTAASNPPQSKYLF